jgi:hypothetical protein
MDNLDQATQHWIDQGGQTDNEIRGHQEMWKSAQEPRGESPHDKLNSEIEDAVGAAVTEVKYRDDDKSDWENSKADRHALLEAYPNSSGLESYVANKLNWHAYFQRDPINAREAYTRTWARQAPFHPKQPVAKVKEEPPADMWQDGRIDWQRDRDIRDAVASASREADDGKQYESTAKLRALVREKTGLSFSDFLAKARAIDAASLDDPGGVAARFSVFSGAPATQAEAQEIQAAVQHQAAAQQAGEFLQAYEASGQLPQDYKSLEGEVAVVLQEMSQHGARSGDMKKDLDFAIELARDRYQKGIATEQLPTTQGAEMFLGRLQSEGRLPSDYKQLEPRIANVLEEMKNAGQPISDPRNWAAALDHAIRAARSQVAAEKARRASRSVSGAPSPGAASGGRSDRYRGNVEDDVYADVAAAVRSVGNRA